MSEMFSGCEMSEGISLGDQFDTSNVEDMHYMFYGCKFPAGFSLGGSLTLLMLLIWIACFISASFQKVLI